MITTDSLIQMLKLTPRYLVAIAIFCGILLFISEGFANNLGIYNFAQNNRQWFGIAFIAATSLIIVDWGIKIISVIRNRMRLAKRKKTILQSLYGLTEEEKQILRFYIAKQSKTNVLRINDGIVNGLIAKGIIYRATNQGSLVEGFAHNISQIAWDYLNINNRLLNGITIVIRTDKRQNLY